MGELSERAPGPEGGSTRKSRRGACLEICVSDLRRTRRRCRCDFARVSNKPYQWPSLRCAILTMRRPRPFSRALGYACASERRWASSALKGSRLAIPLRPLSRLAQDEEPRYAGGEAGGG